MVRTWRRGVGAESLGFGLRGNDLGGYLVCLGRLDLDLLP